MAVKVEGAFHPRAFLVDTLGLPDLCGLACATISHVQVTNQKVALLAVQQISKAVDLLNALGPPLIYRA